MMEGQHIEEQKAWCNLDAAASPAEQAINTYVASLNVNPVLKRRSIWSWCNSCTVLDGVGDGIEASFEVHLFKQGQKIGSFGFGSYSTEFPQKYFPETDDKLTWEQGEGHESMIFRRFWSQAAGTIYKQSRFVVSPVRVMSECDSIRLFVKSYKSLSNALLFMAGLRVISQRP